MPKKSRTGKRLNKINQSLISFFRKGKLKKFLITDTKSKPKELTFIDAIKIIESNKKDPRIKLDKEFFQLLQSNKDYFDELLYNTEEEATQRRGLSTEKKLIDTLKMLRKEKSFKDEDHQLRDRLLRAFEDGVIARMRSKNIKNELDKENPTDKLKILNIFRRNISEKFLDESIKEKIVYGGKREIILSEYLIS